MVGTSSTYHTRVSRENRKQYYYECNYGKRTGECGNGKIRKELAEEYVLSELEARLLNDSAIPELARKISIHYKQEKMKNAGEGFISRTRTFQSRQTNQQPGPSNYRRRCDGPRYCRKTKEP
ncbi:MAG: hypothetical protein HPY89_04915 [Pelotomaculum sp.]|nr:hypothetical protein [Pelotomaculum sp.]